MTRNTTNTDPKPPRVPVAVLSDGSRLLEFAYLIRDSLPGDSRRHAMTALEHAPGLLEKISAFEIPCGQDPTVVVAWARKLLVDTA